MPDIMPDSIFQVASGFMAAKHLFVANEVGLFEGLAAEPATLDVMAGQLGIDRTRLRILADAMVTLGFVERQGDNYQNAPVAATFLAGKTPADLRPFLRFWNQLSYPAWAGLEEAIRTGQSQSPMHLPAHAQRIFSEGIEARTAEPARALSSVYDFRQHRRFLDLGGGTGSWLLTVLHQNSGLEGALFELPGAAAVAHQRMVSDPAGQRVTIVEGDFFKDPIPGGYDVILMANVVHNITAQHNLELLRRLRHSADEGTRLLLVDFWTDPTHTQPPMAALMAGEFLVHSGEGNVYSEQEALVWLQETGWRLVEHRPLSGPMSLIVAETV